MEPIVEPREEENDTNNDKQTDEQSSSEKSGKDILMDTLTGFKEKVSSAVDSKDNIDQISALAYIPFIGWAIPFLFKPDNETGRFHAVQSVKINILILVISLIVWFCNNVPGISHALNIIRFHYVTNFVLYISVWTYVAISAYVASRAWKGEKWEIPHLDKVPYLDKIV